MTTDPTQQNGNGSSDTASATGVSAVVNPDPNGMVTRYTSNGIAIQVPIERAVELEATFGLRVERYDLDECYSQWRAAHDAVGPVVDDCLRELKEYGCIRDEVYDVLNKAVGEMVDRYKNLMVAVGTTLPREALIVSVREHLDEHGTLDGIPSLRTYEGVARSLPAERVELHRQQRAAADATA